jgi:hypothetical protein
LDATRIIGVSATVSDSERKEAFARACDAFLAKPIAFERLLEKIQSLLGIEWETGPGAPAEAPPGDGGEREGADMAPPPEDWKELFDLAMMGDMRGIRAWADELEGRDGRYARFAGRLRELAKAFKTKALVALVERHGEGEQ